MTLSAFWPASQPEDAAGPQVERVAKEEDARDSGGLLPGVVKIAVALAVDRAALPDVGVDRGVAERPRTVGPQDPHRRFRQPQEGDQAQDEKGDLASARSRGHAPIIC